MSINISQIRIDTTLLFMSIAITACLHYVDAVIAVRFYYYL